MPMPTDRGHVVISDEADGTKTVLICADVIKGHPQNVYAMHVRTTNLQVHPEVVLAHGTAGTQFSSDIVEVHRDDSGVVHVSGLQPVRSLTTE
jgi:hypothetical protein